jgi:hypothetical protein
VSRNLFAKITLNELQKRKPCELRKISLERCIIETLKSLRIPAASLTFSDDLLKDFHKDLKFSFIEFAADMPMTP